MAREDRGVGGDLETIGVADARSALAWWLESGVDAAIQEEPRDWLRPAPPRSDAPPEPAHQTNVIEPSQETLTELQQWLSSSMQIPLAGPGAKRILPHGPEEAQIMLLIDAPALEDAAAGQPIGGEPWKLVQRMLAAIGIATEAAYSASLSCFHTPGARMSPTEREACVAIARRHIALAKPKRLLLFGEGPSQALLGKPLPQARGHAYKVEGVRAVATFHPRNLVNQPSNKSQAWRDLLLLMEDDT
jgi:uracil-DNA glycosylase family 4